MITVRFFGPDEPGSAQALDLPCETGQSLMQAALAANVKGIEADCGGMMTCGTCHVYVREPQAALLPVPGEEDSACWSSPPRRASQTAGWRARFS
jgi:2Fe-2S ferredoxin